MSEHRKANLVRGGLFAGIGMILAAGGVGVALVSAGSATEINEQSKHEVCKGQAERLGFEVSQQGSVLELKDRGAHRGGPYQGVAHLSALKGFCSGHQLDYLCAGQECEDGFLAHLSTTNSQ
ncbi:hypothetical protein [Thioalkalivibrio sp. K90mix]|uniref:hypothetical protein n=1 Tax=Thioalkalivibrio sp. (strain K90mix) TaxID=396595 RepID=UPI0011D145C4|nr:hypothetical protein [Thioalkalivibrio sp. K90mix]